MLLFLYDAARETCYYDSREISLKETVSWHGRRALFLQSLAIFHRSVLWKVPPAQRALRQINAFVSAGGFLRGETGGVALAVCLRCGRELADGKECGCMTTTVRGCDANELRSFYDSPLWRRMCASIRARAGDFDELEHARGRNVSGCVVHHIYPADEYPAMRLLPENLILVSAENHERIHAIYRQGRDARHAMTKQLFHIVLAAPSEPTSWYDEAIRKAERKGRRRR